MIKRLIVSVLIVLGIGGGATYMTLGASDSMQTRSIFPATDSVWEIGTTSKAYLRGSFDNLCLTGDSCISVWPTGGGSLSGGTVGLLTYWTSSSAVSATSSPTVGYITATSTTASNLPYASSTGITATTFWGNIIGNVTGTASLATALGANGANCAAGNFPLGVDASGAVETCTDAWTQAENTSAAYLNTAGVNAYIHGSTTIPKTYTANTFTGVQTIGNASTTHTTVTNLWTGTIRSGTWNGSTIGIAYGGTNSTSLGSHMLLGFNGTSIVATSTPTSARYLATSTTLASTFPYASSTGYTVTDIWAGTIRSGTWNGSTIGIAYGGTNATTFGNNMIMAFNGTSIVSTSTPVVGSIYASSTSATSTFLGGMVMSGRVQTKVYPSFVYASSTAFIGTTTVALGPAFDNQTFNTVKCFTDAGTTDVYFTDGTNRMNWLQASTTVGTVTLSTNNTFTPSEKRYIEIGNPQTSPKSLSCSFDITINN